MSGPYCSCLTVHYAPVQTEGGQQERWACDCGATFFRRGAHAAEQVLRELAPERLAPDPGTSYSPEEYEAALKARKAERQRVIAAVVRFIRDRAEPWVGVPPGEVAAFAVRLAESLEHPGALAPYLNESPEGGTL